MNKQDKENPRHKLQVAARNTGTLLIMYSANLCNEENNLEKTKNQIKNSCQKLIKEIDAL